MEVHSKEQLETQQPLRVRAALSVPLFGAFLMWLLEWAVLRACPSITYFARTLEQPETRFGQVFAARGVGYLLGSLASGHSAQCVGGLRFIVIGPSEGDGGGESQPPVDEFEGGLLELAAEQDGQAKDDSAPPGLAPMPTLLQVLLCAFFFCYTGLEVGFGGWLPVVMTLQGVDEAHGAYTATMFWLGVTVGRIAAIPLAALFSVSVLLQGLLADTGALGMVALFAACVALARAAASRHNGTSNDQHLRDSASGGEAGAGLGVHHQVEYRYTLGFCRLLCNLGMPEDVLSRVCTLTPEGGSADWCIDICTAGVLECAWVSAKYTTYSFRIGVLLGLHMADAGAGAVGAEPGESEPEVPLSIKPLVDPITNIMVKPKSVRLWGHWPSTAVAD
ncbi:hypothetical protein JKP88DRAFT_348629 [Tribonema minus]|uniref:Uncharacterized protein n=1 Tax=Tribonema minus TaxID=303371 RepID=A0A835YZC7_9STRA|nr:hypothetical protein JKP88DRAFT_348629 [Tribonema minus]